jgi:hypothetical protein
LNSARGIIKEDKGSGCTRPRSGLGIYLRDHIMI